MENKTIETCIDDILEKSESESRSHELHKSEEKQPLTEDLSNPPAENASSEEFQPRFWKRNRRCVFIVTCISVGALIVVLAIGLNVGRRKESLEDDGVPKLQYFVGLSEEYRIDNKAPCYGPVCISCTMYVKGPVTVVLDAMECKPEDEPKVKNASCFLCGDECKSFETMEEANEKANKGAPAMRCSNFPVKVGCCVLVIMGNMGEYCGHSGYYYCNKELLPVCQCPAGKTGPRCEQSYTQQVLCKCYKSNLFFSDQEGILDCNSANRTAESTECHMYIHDHNCLCTPLNTSSSEPACPVRSSEAVQGNIASRNQFYPHFVLFKGLFLLHYHL